MVLRTPRPLRGGRPRPIFPVLLVACCAVLSNHDCRAFTSTTSTASAIAGRRRLPAGMPPPSPSRARLTLSSSDSSDHDHENHSHDPENDSIVIIGGGLAGLSVAHHLATRPPSSSHARHVTLLERELPAQQRTKTAAGSFAAAGMLAPQAERLPAGPLLDLCLASRAMYGAWVADVERGAREGGKAGARYLWEPDAADGLQPWEVGFHATGGFLAPAFAGDAVATWSPQPGSGQSRWLDEVQVRELEPALHPDVVGGWWFPEDASVDARRLTGALRAACVQAGVDLRCGPEWEVKGLMTQGGHCEGVRLPGGRLLTAKAVVVANGAWMRRLLPLPVTPHKGQSVSLRPDPRDPPPLSRVLFAQDTYIVPKADGRIVVGATVEPGRYDTDVTPAGLLHCLAEATRLVPGLADLPIEESWAGLRPTTPDKCPILGGTEQWDNVYLAGGYWRNGVLLAPKTGQLLGDLILHGGDLAQLSAADRTMLEAFSWERFTAPGGGRALAANARYAAQFYPVHRRSTDGVATSVGTELGFYEGAAAAKGDRERDRQSLIFGAASEEEEALERAASRGVEDAAAFSFGDAKDGWKVRTGRGKEASAGEAEAEETETDAVVSGAEDDLDDAISATEEDLPSIYDKIRANKADVADSIEMGDDPTEERADPGFRIYHADAETGDTLEVPPFTSPDEFFKMKAEGMLKGSAEEERAPDGIPKATASEESPNEEGGGVGGADTTTTTFDGYTAISDAFATEEDTAAAMRKARIANRIKTSEIDESKIGAVYMSGDSGSSTSPSSADAPSSAAPGSPSPTSPTTAAAAADGDLSSVYDRIRANKARVGQDVEMGESTAEEKPGLNFTIYHVDAGTREERLVPPYTSPGDFFAAIEQEKKEQHATAGGHKADSAQGLDAAVPAVSVDAERPDVGTSDTMDDGSDEKTYDGYQDIQKANSSPSRDEELLRMKEARMANRAKASEIMGGSSIEIEKVEAAGDAKHATEANGTRSPKQDLLDEVYHLFE